MKIEDKLLLSALSGTIAAAGADLFLFILNLFIPGNNINMPELVLEFFLNIDPNNLDTISLILGFIWSLTVGGVYAFILLIILDMTGRKMLLLKSILVVISLWLMGAGILTRLLNLAKYVRDEPLSIAAFFTAHFVFALILAYFIKIFDGTTKENK